MELLLDRKVGKVAYSETQKSIDLALDQKGVRLDVYFEDDFSTAYNIEMQTPIPEICRNEVVITKGPLI